MLNELIKTAYARGGSSSERTTNLGRRAARLFIGSDDRNLTSAVSAVVSEEGDLSRDQIRRVSEAANQAAWNDLFVEGDGKTGVSFDPANAEDVLSEVAPSAPEIAESSSDYDAAPPVGDLDRLLGAFESEKPPEYGRVDPAADAAAAHEKVSHARDFAQSAMESSYIDLTQQAEKVYGLIKTAMAERQPFELVCKAIAHACEDPAFAADVLKIAASRLQGDRIEICMDKVAHQVVINGEHPLVVEVTRLEKQAQAYVRSSDAFESLNDQSKKTLGYIRDKLRGV
tara:strand:- start:3351 stop:4205 length:855 start_codon:yes stop_codon:yes gene_type:complete